MSQLRNIGPRLLGILFVLLVAVAQPVTATIIPVGSAPADDVIFNFDFGLSTPPPPYDHVTIRATFAGGSPANQIYGDVFGGLDGTGGLTATDPGVSPVSYFALALGDIPSTADGLFSVGLRLDGGVATIATFTATACNALGSCVELNGAPVPEPATLALLGLGLFGIALTRLSISTHPHCTPSAVFRNLPVYPNPPAFRVPLSPCAVRDVSAKKHHREERF